jgi:hypothetical protein
MAVIYILIFAGLIMLIILVVSISLHIPPKEIKTLMYYKLDIASRKITTISSYTLHVEISNLNINDYSLISLADLNTFMNNESKLPTHSYMIAVNEFYSYTLKKALPVLIKDEVSIIIFLPILISSTNNKYQEKQVQQLNGFIFSDEFKNIFSYTQLNSQSQATNE